ncbi:hypothetical protein BDV95DRAFT_488849 [Massariosphaeria phaeospora]|uniref:Uncharacterized protein n=1 Tax=Massariosphaeria phaeospora TaxID=100035 RepID=A0A7C8MBB7_9PLEO|nr:hypothetical protein BDV95DRAFT_488849 [Massariosphaeria phaeospora]
MPTHTPSPRRFLAPNPPSTQRPKSKPQSSLRHNVTAQTPKFSLPPRELHTPVAQSPRVTPAKRFVLAPTPSDSAVAKGKDRVEDEPWQSTPRPRPARKLKRVESIEEASQSSPSASPDDGAREGGDILFNIEARNKRRRVTPEPRSSSPSQGVSRYTPASAHSARFRVPAPRTPAIFANASVSGTPAPATTNRPQFLLPPQPPSPVSNQTPLPETFSPSRKNQKYIPGGLASTLQSWVIETANTGYAAQNSGSVIWGKDKEDGVRMKVRVGCLGSDRDVQRQEIDCFQGGVVFVRGETDPGAYNASRSSYLARDGGEVKLLLAGQGGSRGAGVRIKIGAVIGLRAPLWDVDIGDEKWVFGVDWVLL